MLQYHKYTYTRHIIVPCLNSIVLAFHMQNEIIIHPSVSLKMAEVMTRWCVDKVGPRVGHFAYTTHIWNQ